MGATQGYNLIIHVYLGAVATQCAKWLGTQSLKLHSVLASDNQFREELLREIATLTMLQLTDEAVNYMQSIAAYISQVKSNIDLPDFRQIELSALKTVSNKQKGFCKALLPCLHQNSVLNFEIFTKLMSMSTRECYRDKAVYKFAQK